MTFTRSLPFFLFTLLLPIFSFAQSGGSESRETINVYLDCRGCNDSYVRTEVNFVNFVRDQSDAEVHLLITLQQTGSGGWEHTLNFIGMSTLNTQSQKMKFISPKSDTNDMMRNRLVKYVKLGLVYFLADRDVLSELNVNFSGVMNNGEEIENRDPWNSWIFRIGGSTNFSGEQSEKDLWVGGSVDARRITEHWKIRLEYDQSYKKQTFYSEDEDGNEETDIYVTENKSFFGLLAHSLGDHWTVGSYSRIRTSTQDNIDLSIGATPSVEFSLFPYNEHARREVTFRYGVLGSQYNYTEATIYDKEEEFLWRQELSVRTDFTQPWGGIYGWLDAGNYMHDFTKNRVNMGLQLNMRVMRGLSVFLSGRYSVINDQLSLAAGEVSEEERLLNLKQQATSYNYRGSVGLEFDFGSVYSNVVNSRF